MKDSPVIPLKPRQRAPGAGRPRKPNALHDLHGTRKRGVRGEREAKPDVPTAADLVAPDWLGRYGKQFWRKYAPLLVRLRLMTVADLDLFAAACERWDTYRRMQAAARRMVVSEKAFPPQYAIAKQALDQCKSILTQFGMGPASRTKVAVAGDEDKPEDPGEAWARQYGVEK